MKKLFLHIGVPKTGSQMLIGVLGDNQYTLLDNKILWTDSLYGSLIDIRSRGHVDGLQNQFAPIKSAIDRIDCDRVVTICEGLTGDIESQEIHSHRGDIFSSIADLFKDFEIYITVTVRRQDQWIESVYGQYIKEGGTLDFQDWYKDFDGEYCYWSKLIDMIKAFKFNFNVIPMELLDFSFESYIKEFTGFFGIDLNISNYEKVDNPGISPDMLNVMREFNKKTTNQKAIDKFRLHLTGTSPKKPFDPFGLLTSEQRLEIINRYKDDNKKLFKMTLDRFQAYEKVYTTDSNFMNWQTRDLNYQCTLFQKYLELEGK